MQNVFQWTIGVHFFNSEKFKISDLKKLLNPGLIAIFIGMSMFFLGLKTPPMLLRVIKGVGAISIPLSLMMIGATLGDFKLKDIISDRGAQFVAFFKSLAFPAVFLIALFFIPIDSSIKSVLIIMSAAPVQASSAVIAKNFGGDSIIVAKTVALTTFLCVGTIPLFLMLIG
jgi:predicted permease